MRLPFDGDSSGDYCALLTQECWTTEGCPAGYECRELWHDTLSADRWLGARLEPRD